MIYDTLVIGAGQAGLSAAFFLKKRGRSFIVLEAAEEPGSSWKNRYDSLVLFSPAKFSSLPGLPFPSEDANLPTKEGIADYLKTYADVHQFNVILNSKVQDLTKEEDVFCARTGKGDYRSRNVIVATGPHQTPRIPAVKGNNGGGLFQVHSHVYRNPSMIPAGKVLVVGGGNSAADIAVDLMQTHKVHVSARSTLRFMGLNILGKNVLWWGHHLRLLYFPTRSLAGKIYRAIGEPIYRKDLKKAIKSELVSVREEVVGIEGETVHFKDGGKENYSAIVWATGYQKDLSWIKIPGLVDVRNELVHHKGISRVPGLYFLGLEWQRSRSSALLAGIGRDAEFIVNQLRK